MARRDIRRYSLDDLDHMAEEGAFVDTAPEAPEVDLNEDFWRNARLIMPGPEGKKSVHLRVDADVLDWFKAHGKGHLTRMNAVLRAYMEAHRRGTHD